MSKINILPAKVYNRIAAGEVVDRPYSVVKELVENAIDAGATEIEIHVENGGKQLIRVIDNGCGIERDDLQSAFLPHATSKIAKAEDLDNIMTLGFRGEAVASIAAVSRMTITSKVAGAKCYRLTSNGGELGAISEAAGENGTRVDVEMLFFNAPVRVKFLKSDKAEEADITTFVSRFILNRSDIAFTYYVNGQKVLQSFGGGDEEALLCVYGAAVRAQCIEINAEKHGIRIRGYIGNQHFSKPNKSYQSIFLNGRYVLNSTLAAAVSGAYNAYLMKRQYPFYVLHITVPTEIVDVNVHPNKADVRFADNKIIYGCIFSVISAVLDGKSQALEYIVADTAFETEAIEPVEKKQSLSARILQSVEKENQTEQKKPSMGDKVFGFDVLSYEQAQKEILDAAPAFVEQKNQTKEQPEKKVVVRGKAPEGAPVWHDNGFIPMDMIADMDPAHIVSISEEEMQKRLALGKKCEGKPEKLLKLFPDAQYNPGMTFQLDDPAYEKELRDKGMEPLLQQMQDGKDYFEENKRYLAELDKKAKQDKMEISSFKYVGKIFNTYLLYERDQDVYIIDQHAAHERLIFDRMKARMQSREVISQPMLIPYTLELNAFEATFIRERLDDIRFIGFDIQEKDETTFEIYAVPVDIPSINLNLFFNQVLGEINGYRAIKMEEILKDKLAAAACKAAIKGGMDLERGEIDELFTQIDGNMGLKCPHGRPVVVQMSRKQIEKMFKRIV